MFGSIPPELQAVFDELRVREPIFHRPEYPTEMASDYWEVGASGRRYSREFILRHLEEHPPVDAASAGWTCSDYGLIRLGPDTYLFTCTLHQAERITRRTTVWRSAARGWIVLYHQGTIVTAETDEVTASQ